MKKIIVIGGGASGLMAAGIAAERGLKVILIEKMNGVGKKLAITGKGRCNITNNCNLKQFIQEFGKNGRFLYQAFSRFFNKELIDFFEEKGLQTKVERGGRIFPVSDKAKDVVDLLKKWNIRNGVKIFYDAEVSEILTKESSISGIRFKDGQLLEADNIILSTGGSSYPGTGSTGDGFIMVRKLGHTINRIEPALVPFNCAGDTHLELQGLTLKNIRASIWFDGKKKFEEFGDLLFTHFGVSGPIILSLSRKINREDFSNHRIEISIDLKPALTEQTLDERLLRELNQHGKMKFKAILKFLLPRKMIPICIKNTKISSDKLCHQIDSSERKRMKNWLKDFRLNITGFRPMKEAIVTAGGVSLKEINPKTMESKKIKGLYIVGELLDLDANTGGFNLQAAFSTGWCAGKSV